MVVGGYALVCGAALMGVVLTTPGSKVAGENTTTLAAPNAAIPTSSGPRTPDGRVEITADRTPLPLPDEWADVRPLLADAVTAAEDEGLDLTLCVIAIDAPKSPMTCAGEGTELYAASVTKLASAVAALEAWGDDPDAETPVGATVGELIEVAITVSDNDAADLLTRLAASGPDALDEDPFAAINEVTARVGLEESFHSGSYFTTAYWSDDWSHLDAEGAARYLAELVRAADGVADSDGPHLTKPSNARFVLDAMLSQERRGKIPGNLPEGTTANKTGETDEVSHDVAVLNTTGGRLVMASASSAGWLGGGPDEIVADAAEQVVDVFGGPRKF